MKNLNRALRMTLKYRWSLIVSFLCSALVAALWSLNLGAVYPFVQIVLKGHSLHQWVEEETKRNDTIIAEKESLIAEFNAQKKLPGADTEQIERNIRRSQNDIELQQAQREGLQAFAPYIEKYAPHSPFATLAALMGLMFLGTVVRGLFLMGSMVSIARVGQRTTLDLQNQAFQNVLDMETSELGVKGTGDLIGRIRGEPFAICQAITTIFGKTVREPLKMIGCLVGAACFNWRLLLFSMLICPLAGYLMFRLAKTIKRANKRAMEESARLMNRLYQAVTYMRVVKAFTKENSERQRFKTVAEDVYRRSIRISVFSALARINNEILGVSMITLSVLAGGYLVLNETEYIGFAEFFQVRLCVEQMTFGSLMAFFGFLIGIADPLRKMADVYGLVQTGAVAADRVFPLIDQKPSIQISSSPQPIPAGQLDLEFDHVRFEYEPGQPVLNGICEKVPAGTSMAIVGHNGCGKSTLINLILRFFDTRSSGHQPPGSIRVGGLDVRDVDTKELRQKIGYVTQQTMLFDDSIGDNIAYGREGATQQEIESAAIKAHAHEFIVAMENGYDSKVGEHGGKLSGGQRQRLSLARAILKDPEILILDEATSQIDPESEQLIHQTLSKFIKGRTTLVITHRMSTLELVDRIMIMKNGRILDCGTHEQLLARCQEYQKMRNLHLEDAA